MAGRRPSDTTGGYVACLCRRLAPGNPLGLAATALAWFLILPIAEIEGPVRQVICLALVEGDSLEAALGALADAVWQLKGERESAGHPETVTGRNPCSHRAAPAGPVRSVLPPAA